MAVTNEDILLVLREVATSLTSRIDAVAATQAVHGELLAAHSQQLAAQSGQLASHGEMLASQSKQLASHGEMLASQSKQLASHGEMLTSQGKQLASHSEQLAQLRADVTEIKLVVGANYIGLKGRVDQVGDMIMDHMADYHGTGRRSRV